jgi:hypothetical protein
MPRQKVYEQIAAELSARQVEPGLWARAVAECNGDISRAHTAYVRLRACAIRAENRAALASVLGAYARFLFQPGVVVWIVGVAAFLVILFDRAAVSARQGNKRPEIQRNIAPIPTPFPVLRTETIVSGPPATTSAPTSIESLFQPLPPVPEPMHSLTAIRKAPTHKSYEPTKNDVLFDGYPSSTALGRLAVDNGTSRHAIAKIIDAREDVKICSFVVRAGSKGGVRGIPDGTYRLLFAFGERILEGADRFIETAGVSQFKETFGFTTVRTTMGARYSAFEVTLHAVAGGTAQTVAIQPEEFDRY